MSSAPAKPALEGDKAKAMVDFTTLPPSALHSYVSYYDLAAGREDGNFFDAQTSDVYLSQVATRHFAAQPPPKEGEVVVGFLYKCKAKGKMNTSTAHYRIKDPPMLQRRMS